MSTDDGLPRACVHGRRGKYAGIGMTGVRRRERERRDGTGLGYWVVWVRLATCSGQVPARTLAHRRRHWVRRRARDRRKFQG